MQRTQKANPKLTMSGEQKSAGGNKFVKVPQSTPRGMAKIRGSRALNYLKKKEMASLAAKGEGSKSNRVHPLSQVHTAQQPPTPPDSSDDDTTNAHASSSKDIPPVPPQMLDDGFSIAATRGSSVESDLSSPRDFGHTKGKRRLSTIPCSVPTFDSVPASGSSFTPLTPESPGFSYNQLHRPAGSESSSNARSKVDTPAYLVDFVSDEEDSTYDDSSDDSSNGAPTPESSGRSSPESEEPAPDPMAWLENCSIVEMDQDVDLQEVFDLDYESLDKTKEGKDYVKFLRPSEPPEPFKKPAFIPTGRYAASEGDEGMMNVQTIKCLGEGAFSKAYLKKGTLGGEEITFISKEWSLEKEREGFFSELVLYESQEYLRDLQGVCVPKLIGMFKHRDAVTLAYELPHCNSWIEAHPDLPPEMKQKVVDAFQAIHSKGVLHDDVALRHILIGDDGRVTIIDFNVSRAIPSRESENDNFVVELETCHPAEMERELREVKVKLRCEGAVEEELHRIRLTKETETRRSRKRKASSMEDDDDECELGGEDEEEPIPGTRKGIDEYWGQTDDGLIKWLVTNDVSRRMVVPGRTPDLKAVPMSNKNRMEDEVVTQFLDRMETEGKLQPEEILGQESPQPSSQGFSLIALPGRLIRSFGSYLSSFISSSHPPTKRCGEDSERPRKRIRVKN